MNNINYDIYNKMIECTFEDIENAIISTGAIHKFQLVDGTIVYTSKPLTEKEKEEYQSKAKKNLDACVEALSREIDKRIIEEIKETWEN